MSHNLTDKFIALTVREKLMIMLASVVVILLLGITFVIEPAIKQYRNASASLDSARIEQSSLVKQQQAFDQALAEDPNAELNVQLARLTERQQQLETQFARQISELVQPQQMPGLIEQVFGHARNLQLIELISLAPVNIFADQADMQGVALYQHGLRLTFEGRYFAVRDFLAELERLSSQVYWRSMDYQVDKYPQAQVTLEVYTLSTQKAFIGVE